MTILHESYAPSRDHTHGPELEAEGEREVQPFVTPHDAMERFSNIRSKIKKVKPAIVSDDNGGIGRIGILSEQQQTSAGTFEIDQVLLGGDPGEVSYVIERRVAPTGQEIAKIVVLDPVDPLLNQNADYVGVGTVSHTGKEEEHKFMAKAEACEQRLLRLLDDPEVDADTARAVKEAIAEPSPEVLRSLQQKKWPIKGVVAHLLGRVA